MTSSLEKVIRTAILITFTAGVLTAEGEHAIVQTGQSTGSEAQPVAAAFPGRQPARFLSQMEESGIAFGLSYVTEAFAAVRGGASRTRRPEYLGSFSPTLSLDLTRLGAGRGRVYLSGQTLQGRGINDSHVGAVQTLSNLDEQRFGRFIEAWYSDTYRDGLVTIKAGRQYTDAEFGVVENGADFLNSSYGLIPTTPMPTYPSPELGVSAWVAPVSWMSVGCGVFRGSSFEELPEGASINRRGPFTIIETKFSPFTKSPGSHGSYSAGMWRQARSTPVATRAATPADNYGLYVVGDHWFRRSPSGGSEGPGVFFQFGRTPSDRNDIAGYAGAGVAWAGLVPSRRGDSAGIGLTRAHIPGATSENIIELFYKCQVTRNVMLQPDLQWAIHPSGESRKVLVAGIRMAVTF